MQTSIQIQIQIHEADQIRDQDHFIRIQIFDKNASKLREGIGWDFTSNADAR